MRSEIDERLLVPRYRLGQVAVLTAVPRSTLRTWTLREAAGAPLVHRGEPVTPRSESMPFIALAEATLLRGFRNLGVSLAEIVRAVEVLRNELGDEYALATEWMATDGIHILFNGGEGWVQARDRQAVIDTVIQPYLQYVAFDDRGLPSRYRPAGFAKHGAEVIVDPRFGFGRPILERSKINVSVLYDLWQAGDDIGLIAKGYGIEPSEVETALRAQAELEAA